MTLPILYSYRRCPYAMRARLALTYAGIQVELHEISLKTKPVKMLNASPKGTVPVMILCDGTVIEQSLEIMHWALLQQDKAGWLKADSFITEQLIFENDHSFKEALDRYKYAVRFPEKTVKDYRMQCEVFLEKLEKQLNQTAFLVSHQLSLADMAIFPFIRQFANVDIAWFNEAPCPELNAWLKNLIESELFSNIMKKEPLYLEAVLNS